LPLNHEAGLDELVVQTINNDYPPAATRLPKVGTFLTPDVAQREPVRTTHSGKRGSLMDNLPQTTKPEELAKVYHEVAERAARIMSDFAKKRPQAAAVGDELGLAKAYMDLYARMLADPMALGAHAMNMWLD
jgi:hypothetical protein